MPTELFHFRIFPRIERRLAVGSMHTSYWEEPASNLGPNTNYPGRVLDRFSVPNMVMWWPTCSYNTCTRGRRASFLILLMMGAWRPKHVEWLCRNKTCTVLHQVGGFFDLYYDGARLFGRPACSPVTMPTELLSFRIFPRFERRFAVGSMHTSYWEEPASNLGPDTNYPGRVHKRIFFPSIHILGYIPISAYDHLFPHTS